MNADKRRCLSAADSSAVCESCFSKKKIPENFWPGTYERNGKASIFMFAEPLSGWREAIARSRRTKADWAVEVAHLPEGHHAGCKKITLVCDNLNTHTKGAFYEASEPERAQFAGQSSVIHRNTAVGLTLLRMS